MNLGFLGILNLGVLMVGVLGMSGIFCFTSCQYRLQKSTRAMARKLIVRKRRSIHTTKLPSLLESGPLTLAPSSNVSYTPHNMHMMRNTTNSTTLNPNVATSLKTAVPAHTFISRTSKLYTRVTQS